MEVGITDDYEEELVEEMLQALEQVDPDLRREYDEAIELAPELVLTETNFMDFLRTESFHAAAAATRYARYWKFRKYSFGNRWLLPLDQTGRGALSEFDIQVLRSGFAICITRPNQGPVTLYDVSKLPCTAGWASTRCHFYAAKVLAKELCSSHGGTLIYVVTSAKRHALSLERGIIQYCVQGLPARIKQIIVAQSYEEGKQILIDTLAEQQAAVAEYQCGFAPYRIRGDSVRQTLDLLESKIGVQRQYVPLSLGGSLPQSFFDDFIRMRLDVEDPLSAAPVMLNVLPPANNNGKIKTTTNAAVVAATRHIVATSKDTANETAMVAFSHKKRAAQQSTDNKAKMNSGQRINLTLASLQEQKKTLEYRNETLRKDNRRLEGLLSQARYVGAVSEQARAIVNALGALGQTPP